MHYIFSTILTQNVTLEIYLLCMLFSTILGAIIAFTASRKKESAMNSTVPFIFLDSGYFKSVQFLL